ncbi:glutamine synthetase family protein [Aquirufa rosea]|uniref:Glutamine synthetase n=1 Tax=Aquirufa rosea TaxID=2509241 RepID=A0A4Q1C0I0_9BACT|nr:glutamine synthetase family protein [Aquirufa rosea]RXK49930.1 glutamine synthetase [Aquirufa rosea]
MTSNELKNYLSSHPTSKVKIAFTDIDGVLRGKYISTDKFLSILEKGTTFCDVVFGWDSSDALYSQSSVTGWQSGFPDMPAQLDLNTFRLIPWENNLPFVLGDFLDANGHASPVCPRQLLKKIIAEAEEMRLKPIFAQEFEWFNFAETPDSAQSKNYKNLQPISPGMFGYSVLRTTLNNPFFRDLFDQLNAFKIPIEGLHTETGPGTYEAAIAHAGALEAADRAVLFKTAVKEIAYQHQIMATFMAKIDENLPGCGGHVHQSLWDADGKNNLFYDAKDPYHLSPTAKHYLAGILHCLPHILPMFAPTINSYKRLVEGAWAPTTLTWGLDNRTVALRVLSAGASTARIETRVIGADVNPYLAIAASLGAGLYGIKHQLALQEPTLGNGYLDYSHGSIPHTLIDATRNMQESIVAKEIFGEAFVKHFTMTRTWEWQQHLKSVTDWEYKRYFEII